MSHSEPPTTPDPSHPRHGDTYRTPDGHGRITYDPAWSKIKPWCVFIRGDAVNQYHDFVAAHSRLRASGLQMRPLEGVSLADD